MKNLIRILPLLVPSALAPFSMAQADTAVDLVPGTYVWQPEFGGCAVLKVGEGLAYHYDQDCDGGPDFVGRTVRLEADQVVIDDAYLAVHQADALRIQGIWVYGKAFDAEFTRL